MCWGLHPPVTSQRPSYFTSLSLAFFTDIEIDTTFPPTSISIAFLLFTAKFLEEGVYKQCFYFLPSLTILYNEIKISQSSLIPMHFLVVVTDDSILHCYFSVFYLPDLKNSMRYPSFLNNFML